MANVKKAVDVKVLQSAVSDFVKLYGVDIVTKRNSETVSHRILIPTV